MHPRPATGGAGGAPSAAAPGVAGACAAAERENGASRETWGHNVTRAGASAEARDVRCCIRYVTSHRRSRGPANVTLWSRWSALPLVRGALHQCSDLAGPASQSGTAARHAEPAPGIVPRRRTPSAPAGGGAAAIVDRRPGSLTLPAEMRRPGRDRDPIASPHGGVPRSALKRTALARRTNGASAGPKERAAATTHGRAQRPESVLDARRAAAAARHRTASPAAARRTARRSRPRSGTASARCRTPRR
jgi:hypothetical protein